MKGELPGQIDLAPGPDMAENAIWELIERCWKMDPASRPTCQEIPQKLKRQGIVREQDEGIGDNIAQGRQKFLDAMRKNEEAQIDLDQVERILNEVCGPPGPGSRSTSTHFSDNVAENSGAPQAGWTSQPQGFGLRDLDCKNSPGSFVLEEEPYKLHQNSASQSGRSHHTLEVTHDKGSRGSSDDGGGGGESRLPPSGQTTIPDTNSDAYPDHERWAPPPLSPLYNEEHDAEGDYDVTQQRQPGDVTDQFQLPPWQKVHQRLLNWALTWPVGELDQAYNSTMLGNQVNETALSIWATQVYKRYVRVRLMEGGVVDRLFVPPNIADAINNAVFNGRHGDACGMLKDLWNPFGLDGIPRLIIVLAKHRSDADHWVVHR